MDRVLRSGETIKIIEDSFEKSFNYNSNFLLFPIRHHSPVCSYHLTKVMEEYKPEIVLIEGPHYSTKLIPYMVSQKTLPPFCIYMSYDDKKQKHRAFYPFLEFSPELVALKKAKELGIESEFIDLSFGEKILNTPYRDEEEDREFTKSSYYEMLVERMGCQNFNELWEKIFETRGYHLKSEDFVRELFYYCWYSRKNNPEDEILYSGDIAREYFMAKNIKKAMENHSKVMVITGGIHTVELVNLIGMEKIPDLQLKMLKEEESPSYLMPYSFQEADRNYGYASGMIFPYFYQKVWENITKKKPTPFEDAVLSFIINLAGILRKKQALSIADEIQAQYMVKGLATLRDKVECGVFELIDGVKSAFIKGELNLYYQPALDNLYRLLTGMKMGSVDEDSGVPPLVNDFLEKCRKYKLDIGSSVKKESKLDIYNNSTHREKSRFFHQLVYLGADFCSYIKGHENGTGKGRILLRETWEYRFTSLVQTNLISSSAYGATTEETSINLIKKEIFEESLNSEEISNKLLEVNKMGLISIYKIVEKKLSDIIFGDVNFYSVGNCFENLCEIEMYNRSFALEISSELENLKKLALDRVLTLFYTVMMAPKDEEDSLLERVKYLYTYFIDSDDLESRERFLNILYSFYQDIGTNSALSGIATGILFKSGRLTLEEGVEKFKSYIEGTDDSKRVSASFLKGFFTIAKDIVFVDNKLLKLLDEVLKDTENNIFMEILPDLRMAFTHFLPFETDRIAQEVADFYQAKSGDILYEESFDVEELEELIEIDRYCNEKMSEWLGVADE